MTPTSRWLAGAALCGLVTGASAQAPAFLNINPSWSPDGRRILFDSDRDGDEEVYVMDADGGNAR